MLYLIVIWNVIVFLMYGIDKLKAIRNGWRISEKALLVSAAMLGGVGAYLGMEIWRHKTKHKVFRIILPILAVVTIVATEYII